MVSYKLSELPEISEERKAELRTMASLPDSEIDTSDIPEMTEAQFKLACAGISIVRSSSR
jgi:hypothetical protein